METVAHGGDGNREAEQRYSDNGGQSAAQLATNGAGAFKRVARLAHAATLGLSLLSAMGGKLTLAIQSRICGIEWVLHNDLGRGSMGLVILRVSAIAMNSQRWFLGAAIGLAIFIPLTAGRAVSIGAPGDTDAKLVELQKQVSETCAVAANKTNGRCDNLTAALLDYQKKMNREAREGRQLLRADEEVSSKAEQQRLLQNQHDIEVAKEEAGDRRAAAEAKSSKDAVESPCRSLPNPCPKTCAGQPCR